MQQPDYISYKRKNRKGFLPLIILMIMFAISGIFVYQIPRVNRAVNYRLDMALTYIRKVVDPVSKLPTPAVRNEEEMPAPAVTTESSLTVTPEPTITPMFTPTATLVPTPIPAQVQLNPPAYDEVKDKQDLNNCGPATLALYLRYFGWSGNQFDISKEIKPTQDDRNVNVEELVYYVRTKSGWLNAEFRVGGNLDLLKRLVAAGEPVILEEAFTADRLGWPGDDLWAGHYILVTGYDDGTQEFTIQDSEYGPNQKVSYSVLDEKWETFNRVYIMVYPPENEEIIKNVLGADWDVDVNRQNALDTARTETLTHPKNAFAWFNLGTNLVYFEKYTEAAAAYDTARTLGLPQRMLRYQFGPFFAYFNTLQTDELLTLTKYALQITRTSEEAMLWRGYAEYRNGNNAQALSYFRNALRIRPGYVDAIYAIDLLTAN